MELQIIISIFVAFVLLRLVQGYRRRQVTLTGLTAWTVLWLAVLAVFWSPDIASSLAFYLGIGRGADLLIYSAIIVVFYLLYRVFIRMEKLNHDITTLTRKIALNDPKDDDSRSGNNS